MKTSIRGLVKSVEYTTEECQARMAEIEAELLRMGLTMDEARAHQEQYRLTEKQYLLVEEHDKMAWLAG